MFHMADSLETVLQTGQYSVFPFNLHSRQSNPSD
jgi:hypothetical protein